MAQPAETALDIPDGMQANHALDKHGRPVVVFYTGRFAAEYDTIEVRELIVALEYWLEQHAPANEERTPAGESSPE